MANIRDVAQRAGVSVSTVSNLLNGRTNRMRPETLARIEAAITELQFSPNRAARQLKTGQVNMLGLLVPSIVNPSFAELAHEIDIAAKQHGYRVLLGNTYRNQEEERTFLNDLLSQGIRGMIVVSTMTEQSHFHDAIARGLVMVNYDMQTHPDSPERSVIGDNISMDNFQAGNIAAQHLINRGCQNIAFVTESGKTVSRMNRISGFIHAAQQSGLSDHYRIIEGKARSGYGDAEMTELGKALAKTISQQATPPDGIVAVNDVMAIGLIAGFRTAGIRVPEDISVVGIDNTFLTSLITPALTSVAPPLTEIATVMVDRLIARLDDPAIEVEEFLFLPELVIRESVVD
ncbi:LacI family DNA-binding transcriptional regulator [Limnobaculum xujianqingii]|uniref:LacI family DNA-binding transcriptional regulator n=1 Tax=Limnobaculum xujianqingii TaxID=2738837 RepID=UPI00112BD860|nr:LacI family DNA-binding transcriptional regulator [Limnobaculum xujianqingii]